MKPIQEHAPDYGEPWPTRAGAGYCYLETDRYERAAACINACAGMTDPAAEIAKLREENARLREAIDSQ